MTNTTLRADKAHEAAKESAVSSPHAVFAERENEDELDCYIFVTKVSPSAVHFIQTSNTF